MDTKSSSRGGNLTEIDDKISDRAVAALWTSALDIEYRGINRKNVQIICVNIPVIAAISVRISICKGNIRQL